MNNIGFQILRPIAKLFSLICLNPKIEGKKNIPKGAYILASNHLSWLDPILIGNITPRTIVKTKINKPIKIYLSLILSFL